MRFRPAVDRAVAQLRQQWPAFMAAVLIPLPLLFVVLRADLSAVRFIGVVTYVMIVAGMIRSSGSLMAMGTATLAIAWTSSDPSSPGTIAPLVGVGVVAVALAADRWERRRVTVTAEVRSERAVWTVFGVTSATCAGFAMSQLLDQPERSMEAAVAGAVGLIVVSAVVYRLGDGGIVHRLLNDRTDRPDRDVDRDVHGGLR